MISKIRRRIQLVAIIATALAAGCVDYQEEITVARDGSVEIRVYATVVKSALPMLRNRPELKQLLLLPDNAQMARQMLPESIKIKYWVVTDGPGIKIFDAAVTVESLSAMQSDFVGLMEDQTFRLFIDEDGLLVYRREVAGTGLTNADKLGIIKDRLTNSKLEFKLNVPTEIVDTNGQLLSPNSVIWSSNLLKLRDDGVTMMARMEPPPAWWSGNFWTSAITLLILLAMVAIVIRRIQRARRAKTIE